MDTVKFLIFDVAIGKPKEITGFFTFELSKLPEVEFITKPSDDFYILLCPISNFYWFPILDTEDTHSTKLWSMDQQILSDLRNKKCGLLYIIDTESFGIIPYIGLKHSPNVLTLINKTAEFLQIDRDLISYSDNNYKLPKLLVKSGITSIWCNLLEVLNKPEKVEHVIRNIKNKSKRNNKFLYLGGKPRDFRLKFLNRVLKIPDFETNSLITTGTGSVYDEVDKKIVTIPAKILDYVDIQLPYGLDDGKALSINLEFHTNTYINIIPMSHFYRNHSRIDINEKLFKPIICLQPFIILGEPELLKSLHELGYKTFDKWINEDYDLMLDDNERLEFIVNEVKRLNSLSYDELTEMLSEMLPILEHNANLHKRKVTTLYNQKKILEEIKNKYNI
jgi:hypothetical protein